MFKIKKLEKKIIERMFFIKWKAGNILYKPRKNTAQRSKTHSVKYVNVKIYRPNQNNSVLSYPYL